MKSFNIKRILVLFIVVINFIACFNISFAHSGRTDSNGGHYDRSTGEYHYHNGGYIETYEGTIENVSEDENIGLIENNNAVNDYNVSSEESVNSIGNTSELEKRIIEKDKRIQNLKNIIVEKDKNIEELENAKTGIWILCGFIFVAGVYIAYHVGNSKN